jgi:hypothetical protein
MLKARVLAKRSIHSVVNERKILYKCKKFNGVRRPIYK